MGALALVVSGSARPFEEVLCRLAMQNSSQQQSPPAPAGLAAWQASECGQQRPLVVRGGNLLGKTLKTAEAGGLGPRAAEGQDTVLTAVCAKTFILKPNQPNEPRLQRRKVLR